MRFLTPWIEKALKRGEAYTSLDAMKLFAIVNMTADHIGYYFCPHELWWRAIGRITFPVWFFLVGYSRGRELGKILWIYAIILIIDHPVLGFQLFPLNALVSIILCRYFLNFCEDKNLLPNHLPELIIGCAFLTIITPPFFEYGSIAFLFAMFGRMRLKNEKKLFGTLVAASYVVFIAWQFQWFDFDPLQRAYVAAGTFWVVLWLAQFTNDVLWPDWKLSRFKTFIAVLSRNTLPYYFYHRLIFEIVAAFTLGQWSHLPFLHAGR